MNPKILDLVPWDAVMPSGPQTTLLVLSWSLFALSLWFIASECRRRKDWLPVFAFIGGGLTVIYEPLGDMLASVLYPIHNQVGWIDMFGRQIPMFIGVLYFWYMSVPAIYFVRQVEQGLTKASLWRMYFLTLVLATGIELYGVSLDAWIYYGPHPYLFYGVPIWCPVSYSAFVTGISIGLTLISKHLDRKHHWVAMFGVPLFMAGTHMVVSLPAAGAMFSTTNPAWIWLGGTTTIALSLLLTYVASLVFCKDAKAVNAARLATRGAA